LALLLSYEHDYPIWAPFQLSMGTRAFLAARPQLYHVFSNSA